MAERRDDKAAKYALWFCALGMLYILAQVVRYRWFL